MIVSPYGESVGSRIRRLRIDQDKALAKWKSGNTRRFAMALIGTRWRIVIGREGGDWSIDPTDAAGPLHWDADIEPYEPYDAALAGYYPPNALVIGSDFAGYRLIGSAVDPVGDAGGNWTAIVDVDAKIATAIAELATGTATDALYVYDTQALVPGRHHVIQTAGATTQYAYGGRNYTVATLSVPAGARTGQLLSIAITGVPDARITGTFTGSNTDILITSHDTVFSLEWTGTAWRHSQ